MDIDKWIIVTFCCQLSVPYGYRDEDMLHKGKTNDTLASVLELISTKSLQVWQGHL